MCEAPGHSGEGGGNLLSEVHQPHHYLCKPFLHTVKLLSNACRCPTTRFAALALPARFAAYADSVRPGIVKQQDLKLSCEV